MGMLALLPCQVVTTLAPPAQACISHWFGIVVVQQGMKELTLEQREQQRHQQQPVPPEQQVRLGHTQCEMLQCNSSISSWRGAGLLHQFSLAKDVACMGAMQGSMLLELCVSLFDQLQQWQPRGMRAFCNVVQIFEGRVVESEGRSGGHVITAVAGSGPNKQTYNYATDRVVGNGSFGVVFQATCLETAETVSIQRAMWHNARHADRASYAASANYADVTHVMSARSCAALAARVTVPAFKPL